MSNQFLEFQNQVEAVKRRCANGEITDTERDDLIRQMRLEDEVWGDVWMLSPTGDWFRKAKGSDSWLGDSPVALVDPAALPPILTTGVPGNGFTEVVDIATRFKDRADLGKIPCTSRW